MIEIPLKKDGSAWRTLSVNLSGVSLSIRLLWNNRDQHWFADFESVDGKNNGIRLVINTPLLGQKNHCLKGGDIIVLKKTLDCNDVLGFENLGGDYTLNYIDDNEREKFVSIMARK